MSLQIKDLPECKCLADYLNAAYEQGRFHEHMDHISKNDWKESQ
jgi:hypothetical protein